MVQNVAVCESLEPPSSHTTTIFPKQLPVNPLQEQLPLFGATPCRRPTFYPQSGNLHTTERLSKKHNGIQTTQFRERFFSAVADADWNDWKWQMKNRIRTFAELARFLPLSAEERAAEQRADIHFPLAITPYYLSLFYGKDPCNPLRKSMVPQVFECLKSPSETDDPLGEESQSPVHGLVHRYPDRVLFLVTTTCSCYCRYCTRSRVVGSGKRHDLPQNERWKEALAYIKSHTEIRDVLVSGGDPFMLSDDQLQWLLAQLRKIPHVEMIRIGTKTPMVLPQRITPQLVKMLRRYHPLFISIHATHPDEITRESSEACRRLADAGIPLGSQTVLLAGINDSAETMKTLFHRLLKVRVRPYYLYQCDPINGSGHFRTPVQTGIDIIESLRGHTSGYAVPTFVIDAPGGGGKIPVVPGYVAMQGDGKVILRNYNNGRFIYPDEKAVPDAGATGEKFLTGEGI